MTDFAGRKLGKYELIEPLGKGGMAEVWKAFQPGVDRNVAIKVMHKHLADDPDFVERFRREAKAIGQIRHHNIMRVIDFDIDGDEYYMVMDYIEGGTLDSYMRKTGALPVEEALRLTGQLVDAVAYAHQLGMVHRDIKPANVMFQDNSPVLMDFGIARLLSQEKLTVTGSMVGTPAYMSPEAIRAEEVDGRADIYSLGVMLYEMIVGRTPYEADSAYAMILKQLNDPLPPPRKLRPELPEFVEELILKTLADNPAERYQSAEEFYQAIQQALMTLTGQSAVSMATRPLRAPTSSPAEQPATSSTPPWLPFALAGGGVLLIALLIVGGLTIFLPRDGESGSSGNVDSTEKQAGILRFTDNRADEKNIVRAGNCILELERVSLPPAGNHYELWLAKDENDTEPLKMGQLEVQGNGKVFFEESTNENLLAAYNHAIVSIEPDDDPEADQISEQIAFSGSLSGNYLEHIQQLLVSANTIDDKAFLAGADEQTRLAVQHGGLLEKALADGNFEGARTHAEHVVNILDGEEGEFFGDYNGNGRSENPGDDFGVRAYLAGAKEQSESALQAGPPSDEAKFNAERVIAYSTNGQERGDQAIKKALKALDADSIDEIKPHSDDLSQALNELLEGSDVDRDGQVDPMKDEGGILKAYEFGLLMSEINLFPK